MSNTNTEQLISKTLIRFATVLEIEDNLPTASDSEISRNSFGRRIKVRYYEDKQDLDDRNLPWVWPLLPKHLHIMPKIGETVMVILQSLDGVYGNRFYVGPIISQDYYLNHGGNYEALSLLQGKSTSPLCHPKGNTENDGTYPDAEDVALQGRGDSIVWLKDEELRLMCGHKPNWRNRSTTEHADPGSLVFNKENLAYIQMKYDKFKDKKGNEFHSVINVVADRINLLTHEGADKNGDVNVTDQNELTDKNSIENIASSCESMVYGNELINFLSKFRQIFGEHTHHWLNDPQVICEKDADFWNKDLEELLCKTIKIA